MKRMWKEEVIIIQTCRGAAWLAAGWTAGSVAGGGGLCGPGCGAAGEARLNRRAGRRAAGRRRGTASRYPHASHEPGCSVLPPAPPPCQQQAH